MYVLTKRVIYCNRGLTKDGSIDVKSITVLRLSIIFVEKIKNENGVTIFSIGCAINMETIQLE